MKNSINRRRFIAGVGTTGLGVLTAGSWSRVLGTNDRVVMEILGSGGRGRYGWTIMFQGRKGTMELDDRGYRVFAEPWPKDGRQPEPSLEYKGGIPTDPHVENFLECILSRKEPNAPVEVGHHAVCGPHLANISLLRKTRARLNPEAITAEA